MVDKALLLGINDYQGIGDLKGCENDVRNIANLLTENFGFDSANIRQHVNQEVTKDFVTEGFRWLFDNVSSGDRLVFHFSGHGSYIESEDDDEPIDELICLYDMDIDDPQTYLLDDDLDRFVSRLPTGVFLTVILDTCHSGTGTRNVSLTSRGLKKQLMITKDTARHITKGDYRDIEQKLQTSDVNLLKSLEEDQKQIVYARVYERSERLQSKKQRSPVHHFGQCLAQTRSISLNHQLLAAARDNQTAADAYISGDFHGVFSYYLCQTARALGVQATTKQVIDQAIVAIDEAGYSQIPQNEGPYLHEPLFGKPASQPSHDDNLLPTVLNSDNILKHGDNQKMSNKQLLMQLLKVSEKYLDLANRLLDEDVKIDKTSLSTSKLRSGNLHLVYVHGISQHRQGYSDPWWNALEPHLEESASYKRHEVLWSPVVNPRGRNFRDEQLSPEAREFATRIEMILEDRQQQLQSRLPQNLRSANPQVEVSVRGSGFAIDDFARYMFNETEREEILSIFLDTVSPLLNAGENINLITHSWGTVVAWEGLRRLDNLSLSGQVDNLFLVGSALSLGPVQNNLFGRIIDGRRPSKVTKICNLDASGDVVGGLVSHKFTVDSEFLELDPVDCRKIPFTNTTLNVACAHSSYFSSNNLKTNQDIFARLLNN